MSAVAAWPECTGVARHLQLRDGRPAAAVAGERRGRAALPDGQQVRPLRRPRGRRLPGQAHSTADDQVAGAILRGVIGDQTAWHSVPLSSYSHLIKCDKSKYHKRLFKARTCLAKIIGKTLLDCLASVFVQYPVVVIP